MANSFEIFGIVVRKQEVIDKSQDPPAREIAEIEKDKKGVKKDKKGVRNLLK